METNLFFILFEKDGNVCGIKLLLRKEIQILRNSVVKVKLGQSGTAGEIETLGQR